MINKLPRSKNSQRGFTLLEVLVALTILAVALLALASLQGTAIHANSVANRHTVHSMLMQQTVEDIASYADTDGIFSSAVSGATYSIPGALDPAITTSSLNVASAGTYSASYSIDPSPTISGVTQTTLAQITAFITYNPDGPNKRTEKYVTLKLVR
jgi:prepilin-type N-terminal cleavage/methylation domain-containing protein